MSSSEKLIKSFEFLKIPTQNYDQEQRKNDLRLINKKDKINHLNLIYENIISANVRQADDFSRNLGHSIEAFLNLFDDEDQDVYFVAEECLNKTFKSLIDSCLSRFPADLYRFIRKNGPERSLKGALTRFAELCHLIKPHKCRVYVDFIIKENTLNKIANRTEESIQSVLVPTMNKICSAFCSSMTDKEIKILIQSFLPNLSNDSSVNSYRRVSANCLSIICLYTRLPLNSYYYLHRELLNLILPIDENNEHNKFKIWGVLLCFRFMIIHISELDKSSATNLTSSKNSIPSSNSKKSQNYFSNKNLCQIYEICIYYLNNPDISLVTAALECLQVLIKLTPLKFNTMLVQPGAFSSSYLKYEKKMNKQISYESNMSLMSAITNKLNSSLDSLSTLQPNQITSEIDLPDESINHDDSEANLLSLLAIEPPSKSIGHFYNQIDSTLKYLIFVLAHKFLLNTDPENKLKSDQEVKILQKSIALDCCSSILSLEPALVFLAIEPQKVFISDLIEYVNHSDDKMRSSACLLIGQLINSVLLNNCGNYENWLSKNDPEEKQGLNLEILLDHLNKFTMLENSALTNNICKRFALNSFRSFLPTLIKTNHSSYSLEILINLIQLKNSTYNLVKCELVDLFASIDFKSITNTEEELVKQKKTPFQIDYADDFSPQIKIPAFNARGTQERIIEEIFLYLIGSEDSKIRLEAARCLARFVQNMNFYEPTSIQFQNLLQTAGEYCLKSDGYSKTLLNSSIIKNDSFNIGPISSVFEKTKNQSTTETKKHYSCSPLSSVSFFSSIPWISKNNQILVNNFVQPFYSLIKYFPSKSSNSMTVNNNLNKIIEYNLNYLVPVLTNTLLKSTDRFQFLGCLESLDFIFQTYQPALFYSTNLIDLTNLLTSYLRHPNVSFDLYTHDILFRLISNLFCSLIWLNLKKIDKLIQQLDYTLSSNPNSTNLQNLIELITNSVKIINYPQSIAEQATGLNYSYSLSFNNQSLKSLIDQLFVHITKLLCVLACVIDESSLPTVLTSNLNAGSTAVNSIPTVVPNPANTPQTTPPSGSPNFIRAKISNLTENKNQKPTKDSQNDPNVVPLMSQLPKTSNNVYLGYFQNSSHYLKLYETLKSAFSSYKKSSNITSYDRFLQYLKSTLNFFAQLLESSLSVHEIAPHLDEILLYLRILFNFEPSCSIKCVTLCLKSLFGRNLSGLMFEYTLQQISKISNNVNLSQTNTASQTTNNLGSILSTSLTSLTSFNLPPTFQLNTWSQLNKRQQSSLFTNLIQTNLAQFIRFMYTQTLMFKNDHLLGVQFNQNTNLINLAIQGMDSIEYNLASGSGLPSSSSQSSISNVSSSARQSISKQSSPSTTSSGFNPFSFIKKKSEPVQVINSQQQNSLENKLKQQKTDMKTISQYIKSFELIVIKSLRQYTITTSVNLQTKILDLLIQLIFLNVDYCLLDSDKVFLDYVLKQFEYLEQKRVGDAPNNEDPLSTSLAKTYLVDLYESFDFETSTLDALNPFDLDTMLNKLFSNFENYYNQNSSSLSSGGSYSTSPLTSNLSLKQQENLQAHLLIPKMFDFLILLSNEKKNPSPGKTFRQTGSAGLLTIPKIIQLCDNLIASENSPHTHSIPALRPLVIDLFLNRSNEDSRELEMQHDVIMMTMLRLIQYPSVWPLLTISVLKLKKENDEKWKKVSRQIFDHVFEAIKSFKLKFHEFNGFDLRSVRRYSASHVPCLESVKLLIQLFSSLCPQVYRPIDSVIISLFESAKGLMTNEGDLTSNLCLFISHLYLLLTNASEDQILIRVHYLSQQISIMYQEANILMKGEQKLLSRKASSDFTGDDRSEMSSMSTSASTSSSNLSNFDEIDDTDFDLSDSALFVGKFLLKILDISFNCVRKNLKFNFNSFISANNLTSSTTSGAFLRDLDLNMFKDLNTIQHLISNQIQFLLYILTSGNFNKISAALIKLINNKNANYDTKKFRSSYDEQNRPETNDDEDEDSNQNDDEIDDFGFNSSKFVYQTNKFILFKLSKTNPYLSSMWQYVLLQCHYHDPEYWLLSLESCDKEELLIDSSTSSSNNTSLNPNIQESEIPIRRNKNKDKSYKSYDYNQFKKIQVQFHQHSKIPTLNEKLFKYLTLTIYCDNLTSNQNQFDTTSNLTMLIINNLVDLFELASSEATVIDLFSSIHRNSSASSLFIQSINSNWVKLIEKNKLYLLESCLKSVEGVHLSSSGNLLNLLIEKFFNLPYLSLVRYADHIACQRVEMMHSLTLDELAMQLTDKNLSVLDKFFDNQLKNAGRHQRLLSLLEQLKRNLNNDNSNSPINSIRQSQSIEFFSLYLQTSKVPCDLDKEWFYNIVRSACCYSSNTDIISDSSSLKSKQCALMLKNLDISNCECIINDKNFRLSILKDCLLISALKTQNNIDKLPSALKQAKNLFKDFTYPLWISSTQFLFKKIEIVAQKIPKPIQISISQVAEVSHVFKDRFSSSNPVDLTNYDNKINDLLTEFNFSTLIHPLTESINSYLKSIRQFTYLDNVLKESDYKNIIDFGFFQLAFVNYLSFHKNELISIQCLNESFLCILNVLIDQKLINILSKNTTYSTLVSYLIKDLYQLIIVYFFKIGDENLLTTPRLNEKIDYFGEAQKYSNDVLFNKISLETLLKLRFIINNQSFREKIPFKMRDLIEKIYIGLCRLPVLDRFIRIPDCLWNQNFKLDYSQLLRTDTTALPPLDYLKDPHVLKDYLRHILLIGWTTRNQFEYEYVNMLTFFHNISEDYFLPMSSQANSSEFLTSMNQDQNSNQIINQLPVEEIKERNKCISLLIKGLSTWLIKSSLTPISGNSLNSLYEQVSRNKSPGFLSSPIGKQYGQIKKTIESFNRYNNFTQLNSISISNNSNLLYMLDPTLIDDSDRDARPILDFTQPQPPETLTNLIKISNNLSARYNLLFSTNIERVMLNNLPTNTNSYYYFTQISLEGMLKFLGQWNKNDGHANRLTNSFGESIQNFVTNQIDEVSNKVADLLNDETPTPSFNQNIYEPINNSYLIQRSFNRNSLDITSVLRTVLDYYESFFRIPSTQLKLDIFKSMLYLSNCLFDSRQQYESLCQKLQANFEFLNLFIQQDNDPLMPAVNDLIDESTLGLAIYGDCLSRCCLHTTRDGQSMSSKEFERLNKLVENGLKSTSVIIKISTLHGLIYWLESISLGYLSNDAKILIDHLCKQIYLMKDPGYYLTSNSRYLSSLWSVGFYLIENCLDSIRDAQNFCSTFIKLTYQILNDSNTPYFLFYQLYLGLERLLLSCMVPSFEINTIQKLIINKLYDEQKALCLISLTITSLYANNPGKQMNYWYDIIGQQFKVSENTSSSNSPSQADNPIVKDSKISLPQILELNAYPELQSHLLKVLEVATSFLDRMKSSSTSKEASLYASILPKILCDFLPPHDLLNKLITEFLNSSQHPYPEAVAFVLYKCFDLLQEKGMQTQIQEWCLLSLSNFLQRTSIYESIWLTSCLLVSASQNQWLKSTFPFLLNRYCVFDTIDRAIFYMSVIEFIKQFDDDAQVKSIINAFESHAKPGTPYEEFVKLFVSKSDLN